MDETLKYDLSKELNYYIENQDSLVLKYEGKFLLIVKEAVAQAFDSFEEAFNEGLKKYQIGRFFIQKCTPGEESYTQTFHSRAVFG